MQRVGALDEPGRGFHGKLGIADVLVSGANVSGGGRDVSDVAYIDSTGVWACRFGPKIGPRLPADVATTGEAAHVEHGMDVDALLVGLPWIVGDLDEGGPTLCRSEVSVLTEAAHAADCR
jgi:hypothetical protein